MKNPEIFDGKSLSDLLQDIYKNSVEKHKRIETHIEGLMGHIKDVSDVAVIAPTVAQFIDIGNRNDEALIKIASIVQRIVSSEIQASGNADGGVLSEEEKATLLGKLEEETTKTNDALDELEELTRKKDNV